MSEREPSHGHGHGHAESAHGHAHGAEQHDHPHEQGHSAVSSDHAPTGHAHDHHGHAHGYAGTAQKTLTLALIATASFMFVEAAVGFWSGSLALLADAGHMLADAGALALAVVAQSMATRPRTATSTFGYRRAEVLAAFVNGMVLTATAALILKEAVERWLSPQPVQALAVVGTASVGLVVNLLVAWLLVRGQGQNANIRAALAHVLSDALGSVAAIAAGVVVLFTNFTRADPLLSALIALLVAWSGYRVVRETSAILLEGAPRYLDVAAIERTIRETPGVLEVHDLHVWQISEHFDALSAHIVIARSRHGTEMCREVAERLKAQHQLEHVTIQPEPEPPDDVVQVRRSRTGDVVTL